MNDTVVIKQSILFSSLIFFSLVANVSCATSSPLALAAKVPTDVAGVVDYRLKKLEQVNYFFQTLPDLNELPQSLTQEIQKVYEPLTALLYPLGQDQSAAQRAQEVMGHITKFYQLLYYIAQRQYAAQALKQSSASPATVATTVLPQLNAEQLKKSPVWQHFLHNQITKSFEEELKLLRLVHQQELKGFSYLPHFEVAYYQKTFKQLRKSTELTRLHLLLSDTLRSYYLQDCAEWTGLASKGIKDHDAKIQQNALLFKAITAYSQEDIYKYARSFEKLDQTKTYPFSFVDHQGNPLSLYTLLSQGYDFSTYFNLQKNSSGQELIVVVPAFEMIFTPTLDASQKPFVSLTALGNFLLTGIVKYTAISAHSGKTLYQASFETNKQFDALFSGPTLVPTCGYMELLVLTAVDMLYTDLSEIFDRERLSQSLNLLSSTSLPLVFAYTKNDYELLRAINKLVYGFDSNVTIKTQGCHHFFHSLWHHICHAVSSIGHAIVNCIKTIANAAFDALKQLGNIVKDTFNAIKDEVLVVYYSSCIFPALFQGMSISDSLKHAHKYQVAVAGDLQDVITDSLHIVTDVANGFKAIGGLAAGILSSVVGIVDQKLGDDLGGILYAAVAALVDSVKITADVAIQVVGQVVKLTADFINVVGEVASGLIISAMTGTNPAELGADLSDFGQDLVSSVLGTISLAVSDVGAILKDAMQCVAFIISALTDLVADIGAAVAAVGEMAYEFLKTGNLADAFNAGIDEFKSAKAKINAHRTMISAILMVVILVAVTVATGGAGSALAMGMLALNVAMMVPSIIGSFQSDEAAIDKQKNQEEFIHKYRNFVINSTAVVKKFKQNQLIDSLAHMQSATQDQERSLLYYQNYLNGLFNSATSMESYGMGNNVYGLLQPDQTSGVPTIDVGSLYGYTTNRMNMNGAQGFLIYNPARNTYSQEAVTQPLPKDTGMSLTADTAANPLNGSYWFYDKDLSNIPVGSPLTIDIVFRLLTIPTAPFYVGLYLTERSFDTDAFTALYDQYIATLNSNTLTSSTFLDTWNKLDLFNRFLLNYDHKAKMFVCYNSMEQTNSTAAKDLFNVQYGIYEHEASSNTQPANSDGWLAIPQKGCLLEQGQWYRMRATLKDTTLTTVCYKVGSNAKVPLVAANDPVPSNAFTQTVTVEQAPLLKDIVVKSYAGSVGVIASGAAVEYTIITPQNIPVVSSARQATQTALLQNAFNNKQELMKEADRSKTWQKSLEKQKTAKVGNFTLEIINQKALMQSQFIYKVTGTFSPTTIDYVVLASATGQFTSGNYGIDPAKVTPTGFVSLVSGIVYGNNGAIVGLQSSPLILYQTLQGSLSEAILDEIKAAQVAFVATIGSTVVFANGTFNLEKRAFYAGLPLYIGPSLNPLLKNSSDYYVAGTVTAQSGITNVGQPIYYNNPACRVNALISLVSGQVYTFTTTNSPLTVSLLQGVSLVDAQTNYLLYPQYKVFLSKDIQTKIEGLQATYQTAQSGITAEKNILIQATNAYNNATTAASTVSTAANTATSMGVANAATGTQAATTLMQAAQALQQQINLLNKNISNNTVATPSQMSALSNAIQTATTATANANTIANTLQTSLNAVASASQTPSTTTSSYGSSSSYQGYGGGDDSSGGY